MRDLILLVGNPNAGKSTLFNRLTHGHARVGNWHGVTVDALTGRIGTADPPLSVVDLPGVYDGQGSSLEERFSADYIRSHRDAALLFVSECAALGRMGELLSAFAGDGRAAMLVLTKRRRFERMGGRVDCKELSKRLGIPVLFAEDPSLPSVVGSLRDAPPSEVSVSDMGVAFTPARTELSRIDRILLHGVWGSLIFAALLVLVFFLTFGRGMPGELCKGCVEDFFGTTLGAAAEGISSPVLKSLVRDGLLAGLGSVLSFLPQIALLELFLILLEESGLMARLAVLADGALSAVGLSGRAVFSLLMGFGCTAAAVTTTRGLDDKEVQRRVILSLPYLPCSAKLPVFLTLSASFFGEPFLAVLLLYAMGAAFAVITALLLKRESRPLAMELAPLQLPRPLFTAKSLFFQLKQFIIKVSTVVLAFFLVSWMLLSFDATFTLCEAEDSMLAGLCSGLSFLFAPAGMSDWRIAYAALSGLIAKENVAGAIAMFYGSFPFGGESAFAFAVFLLTCSPCVSAISASAREVGIRRALLYAAVQTGSALLLSYITYFCLVGGAMTLVLLAVVLLAFLLAVGPIREKIHRRRTDHPQTIYRRDLPAGVALSAHAAPVAGRAHQRQARGERSSARRRR